MNKDHTIEELNRKLRDNVKLHDVSLTSDVQEERFFNELHWEILMCWKWRYLHLTGDTPNASNTLFLYEEEKFCFCSHNYVRVILPNKKNLAFML